jgi:hypothetical protein
MNRNIAMLFLAATAFAVVEGMQAERESAFLQTEYGTNPMQQVPVVGSQFAVNPVSTAMQCVVSLTVQFFVIYTALALCRTAARINHWFSTNICRSCAASTIFITSVKNCNKVRNICRQR